MAVTALTSLRYWDKWDRVDEDDVLSIAEIFFKKLSDLEPPSSECFLFDTTNYFTFMARDTESELCRRGGDNKEGRHLLRQVGVALLVFMDNQLPSFRTSKNDDLVRMLPLQHRTDSKIRCHILSWLYNQSRWGLTKAAVINILYC